MAGRSIVVDAIGALVILAVPLPAQTGGGAGAAQRFFDLYYTVGYRFVDVHGSRDRYESDFDLGEGFRATEIRLDGHFENTAWLPDTIRIDSRNLADPYERHSIDLEKSGVYNASGSFHRSRYKYRASGEFHRVDRREQVAAYHLTVPFDNVEVFASFTRSDHDGFWLTNRIGNRNLTPLYTITNVSSPRRVSEDEAELGLTWNFADTTVTVVGEYLDQNENNRWAYSQTAVANPAFLETENTASGSSLEGPGARLNLTHHSGPVEVSVNSRWLERRRRIVGSGTSTGFDIAAFNGTLNSISRGSAHTLLTDGTITYEIADDLVLNTELRYLDHTEQLAIQQTDVTVYPALSTTVVVNTNRTQRTVSRLREATTELDWQAHKSLTLTGGWGWSQEKLRVPDLDPSDADFARGTVIEDGYIFGAHWRPDANWSLRARYRDFGQSGLQLHDIVDHHTRGIRANLGYRKDTLWYDLGVRHHRSQNPVSDSRTAHTAYSLGGGYAPGEDLNWHGSYTFSDIDSRTRSTFYFDPAPTPVSTIVGFRGETHSLSTGLQWRVTERFHASFQASYTTVHGDFELDMYHWSVDFARVLDRGRVGLRVEQMDYHEAGNPDDYDALVTYIYFSAAIKGRRPGAN